jgi:hypothetical protein
MDLCCGLFFFLRAARSFYNAPCKNSGIGELIRFPLPLFHYGAAVVVVVVVVVTFHCLVVAAFPEFCIASARTSRLNT